MARVSSTKDEFTIVLSPTEGPALAEMLRSHLKRAQTMGGPWKLEDNSANLVREMIYDADPAGRGCYSFRSQTTTVSLTLPATHRADVIALFKLAPPPKLNFVEELVKSLESKKENKPPPNDDDDEIF